MQNPLVLHAPDIDSPYAIVGQEQVDIDGINYTKLTIAVEDKAAKDGITGEFDLEVGFPAGMTEDGLYADIFMVIRETLPHVQSHEAYTFGQAQNIFGDGTWPSGTALPAVDSDWHLKLENIDLDYTNDHDNTDNITVFRVKTELIRVPDANEGASFLEQEDTYATFTLPAGSDLRRVTTQGGGMIDCTRVGETDIYRIEAADLPYNERFVREGGTVSAAYSALFYFVFEVNPDVLGEKIPIPGGFMGYDVDVVADYYYNQTVVDLPNHKQAQLDLQAMTYVPAGGSGPIGKSARRFSRGEDFNAADGSNEVITYTINYRNNTNTPVMNFMLTDYFGLLDGVAAFRVSVDGVIEYDEGFTLEATLRGNTDMKKAANFVQANQTNLVRNTASFTATSSKDNTVVLSGSHSATTHIYPLAVVDSDRYWSLNTTISASAAASDTDNATISRDKPVHFQLKAPR